MDYLQRFNFNTMHTPGETNMLADALSRLYEGTTKEETPEEEIAHERIKDINTGLFAMTASPILTTTNKEQQPLRKQLQKQYPSSSLQYLAPSNLHAPKMPRYYKKERQCDAFLHHTACTAPSGCPYHYSTAIYPTESAYEPENQHLARFATSQNHDDDAPNDDDWENTYSDPDKNFYNENQI